MAKRKPRLARRQHDVPITNIAGWIDEHLAWLEKEGKKAPKSYKALPLYVRYYIEVAADGDVMGNEIFSIDRMEKVIFPALADFTSIELFATHPREDGSQTYSFSLHAV